MLKAKCKWYNPAKGYGFLEPEDGGGDVFIHRSALDAAGMQTLNEGDRVSYELVTAKGKTSAGNIKVIG